MLIFQLETYSTGKDTNGQWSIGCLCANILVSNPEDKTVIII